MIMGLAPSVIATQNDIPINDAIQLYSEDLPNADSVEEEFLRWKRRWAVTPERERSQTVASALKKCDAVTNRCYHTRNMGMRKIW